MDTAGIAKTSHRDHTATLIDDTQEELHPSTQTLYQSGDRSAVFLVSGTGSMDNTSLLALLDSEPARLFVFGFALYSFLTIWRKLAARWVNWVPLVAKLTRLVLYSGGLGVVYLGLHAMPEHTPPALALACVAIGAAAAPLANQLARRLRPREKLRRGATVGSSSDVNKQSARALPASDFAESFEIAGVKIPRSAETYHFLVVGSTGSGKSVAIKRLLDDIEARGDIALVVDSGGDFASRYYREERDHILNPFDDRCAPWSPTAELAGPWDAEALSKSMIPDGEGDSKEWNGYAQTFVTSVLRQLVERHMLSIKKLLYYVQAASLDELEPFLAGTPAAAQLVSERTFGSIRTIASNYLATYAYLEDCDTPFSVSKFIRRGQSGCLFFTYRDDQLDSLRNMISCALDIASRTVLSLPDQPGRRVWLIIDEFASIGKVQSIEAFATKARKKGGCLLIGLQAVSQLQRTYGDKSAQSILSCLSSWLVLRCSDPETSEYISTYIGDSEISRMTRGESSSETGGSASLNEQIQTQRAVMPVELQRLENLAGFFKLAGDYPICRVKLNFPKKRPQIAEFMAERDFEAKPMLSLLAPESKPSTQPSAPAAVQPGNAGTAGRQGGGGGAAMPAPSSTPKRELGEAPARESQYALPVSEGQGGAVSVLESVFEGGPEMLEDVFNDLADAYEHEG